VQEYISSAVLQFCGSAVCAERIRYCRNLRFTIARSAYGIVEIMNDELLRGALRVSYNVRSGHIFGVRYSMFLVRYYFA
jgi:hypothetical protein